MGSSNLFIWISDYRILVACLMPIYISRMLTAVMRISYCLPFDTYIVIN